MLQRDLRRDCRRALTPLGSVGAGSDSESFMLGEKETRYRRMPLVVGADSLGARDRKRVKLGLRFAVELALQPDQATMPGSYGATAKVAFAGRLEKAGSRRL